MTPVDSVIIGARMRNVIHGYLGESLSVLAMWQPWATLFVAADPLNNDEPAKQHETRHWYPRGVKLPLAVAIHATKKFDSTTKAALADNRFKSAVKRCGYYAGDARPFLDRKLAIPDGRRPLPLGAIIGVATIDLILSAQPLTMQHELDGVKVLDLNALTPDDRAFGYFEPNLLDTDKSQRFAWHAINAIQLPEPIPHTGRQDALYPLDPETRDRINEQLLAMEAAA